MRYIAFIIFVTGFHITSLCQTDSCPCIVISNTNCEYPRQTGELRIVRQDSAKCTVFKTGKSELILPDNVYYSTEEGDTTLKADSIITQLFKNGLLTSDMLLQEFNRETKVRDQKGDTIDETKHEKSRIVIIQSIQRMKISRKETPGKRMVLFKIAVVFHKSENSDKDTTDPWLMPSISDFTLRLHSEAKTSLNSKTIDEYMRNAEIKCLAWRGFEI